MEEIDSSTSSSLSLLSLLGSLLIALIVFYIIKTVLQVRKQISKASDIRGYWQLFDEGLFTVPILSPYIANGNFEIIMKLIRLEKERQVESGAIENQTAIRVSTPRRNNIVIWDKESVKEILVTKSGSFNKPIEPFYEPFNIFNKNASSILTAPDGPIWKNHHTVVSPSFSTSNLVYMCKAATLATDLLFKTKWDKLMEKEKNGFVLDVHDMSEITLEVIGLAGFGVEFGIFSETSNDGKKFREALTTVVKYDYYLRFFFGNSFLRTILSNYTGNEKALKIMNEKLDGYILDRQEMFKKDPDMDPNDLLSQLVKANMQDSGRQLSTDELKSNAYIFCVAGHETTSTTLQWLMYELSKRPEAQNKAREEAIRIGGGDDKLNAPTFDDYEKMDYIHATVMESLRLHPPVIAMVKDCIKTTKIGKMTIPKGSSMYIHAKACQLLSPDFNNDQYKGTDFAPERFLDKEFKQKVASSCSWFPFSMGNRKCIGYTFSQIETCVILCRLLQFYEFKLLNNEATDKVTEVPGVTTAPGNLKVLVTKRQLNVRN